MSAAETGLKVGRLRSAIGLKLAAEIFGRLAQFGTLALAARTLSLADFGYYSLALVIGFLLAQLADFGLHLSVTRQLSRAESTDFARRALATKLWLTFGLSFLAGLGVFVSSGSFAFFLLILSSLVYSLAEFGFAVLRARGQLPYEARLVVLHRFGLLAGAGLTFLASGGLLGLALAHILASGLVGYLALWQAGVRPTRRFEFDLLRRSFSIGLAIFLSLLAFKLDVPLLQLLKGDAGEVGLYNAAYRLFEPLLLFPAALMAGFFPALARSAQSQLENNFGGQTTRLVALLGGVGLLGGGGLALFAPWVVPLLYGPEYQDAVMTLRLLGLAVPFLFVNSALTHLLLALDKEKYNLGFFAVALILNFGANLLLIPAWGRNGAAFATFLTELGLTLMCGIILYLTLTRQKRLAVSQPKETTVLQREITVGSEGLTSGMTTLESEPVQASKPFLSTRLNKYAFWVLLVLIVLLPYEITQHPLFQLGPLLTVTNLKLVYYVNLVLALATLWLNRRGLLLKLFPAEPGRRGVKSFLRSPVVWLGLLVIACGLSTITSVAPKESFKFTFTLAQGALFWLALPFWLEEDRTRKLRQMAYCLVGGAAVSAGLGLLEFIPQLNLNDWLLSPFKEAPTVAGPFLRLSGSFEYANIAAMYYEMALPFALAGLAGAIARLRSSESKLLQFSHIILWLVVCGLLWEALLLTFSRSALPGIVVATPLVFWVARKWQPQAGFRLGLAVGFGLGVLLVALTVLTSPLMLLRFKTQSDVGWFLADYSSPALGSIAACQQITVPVTVYNQTPLDWQGGAEGPYRLSYHWLDRPDHIYVFEGLRSNLPPVLKAGQAAEVPALLRAPGKPGQYWLVWDVIQEKVSWFSLKSANYKQIPVQVLPDNNSTCPPPTQRNGQAPPQKLPQATPNPERNQLWKVAGQMIAARPLLGVGPDGYRFAYGKYTGLKEWDTRIFANSTPLELAADLGLVGVGLFVVFVALAIWQLLVLGWQGRLALFEAAALAALVAFSLHGLLDYFLGFHSIFILCWILLGVAATVKKPQPTN